MLGRFLAMLAAAAMTLSGGAAFAQESKPSGGGGSTGVAAAGLVQEGQRILTDGREARMIVPGKTSTLELNFFNQGERAVRGALAKATHVEGATVTPREARIGDVEPGKHAVARFEVRLDGTSTCTDFFGLGGELVSADGAEIGYFKAGFPVACPGSRLSLESITLAGGDGDQSIEPGETVMLTVVLRNDGADPARGVNGTLRIKGEGVETVVAASRWPDIAPGETAASLTPFTIRVSPDAKTQEECKPAGNVGIAVDGGVVQPAPASEPGADSTGSDTPVTSEDGNAGSTEPAPPSGAEPAPMPAPAPDRPLMEQPQDPGVALDALFEVKDTDRTVALEYSNRIMCAFEERGGPATTGYAADQPLGDDARAQAMHEAGAQGEPGSTTSRVLIVAGVAAGALLLRRRLVRPSEAA